MRAQETTLSQRLLRLAKTQKFYSKSYLFPFCTWSSSTLSRKQSRSTIQCLKACLLVSSPKICNATNTGLDLLVQTVDWLTRTLAQAEPKLAALSEEKRKQVVVANQDQMPG